MRSTTITAIDISKVTGYSRNQVRGLLDDLPIYSEQAAEPRVAREYTRSDLLVLAVIHHLESRIGVRRKALAQIVEPLRKALSGPKTIYRNARLRISIDPPDVSYLAMAGTPVQDGILVSLEPIFDRVDGHLDFGLPPVTNRNRELEFGPMLVSQGRKKVAR